MKQTSQILFPSSLFLESDWDAIALRLDFQYHFYTSTARALKDTSLFVIHKVSFEKLLRLHPDLAEAFTQELTKETEIYQGVRQQLDHLKLKRRGACIKKLFNPKSKIGTVKLLIHTML